MFDIIKIFGIGLLLGVPMGSLGIKCYYNNNVPMGEVRDDPPVECQDETPLDKPYCLWTIEGRNPGKYQQLCPEGELADLQSQGGPDRGCKDMTLDGQTNTVCVCFTDECNKSKEMAMKSGNDKGVGNVIFIALSLIFLLQFK